jgi:hypothetical protein
VQFEWVMILSQVCLAAGGLFIFCAGAFWRRRPSWLLFAAALIAAAGAGAAVLIHEPGAPEFLGMLDTGGYARFFIVLLPI